MKCPHCNKIIEDRLVEKAELNAESYGSSTFVFKCKKCKRKYAVYFQRIVKVSKPYQVKDNMLTSY